MINKIFNRKFLQSSIAVCLLILFVSQAFAQKVNEKKLSKYIENSRTEWNIPGIAVGVVKNNKVVFAKGFGFKELGKPSKVDEHTLFAVASNSKAFTATLLGTLIEDGKIESFDTKAQDLLPGFKMYDPFASTEMTIRDLLTHRSGLQTFGGDHLWIGDDHTSDEILQRLRYFKPSAPFRTRFQYNNLMFMTAGMIIPAVTGKSWVDYLQERIFDQIGMTESNAVFSGTKTETNVARPHEYRKGKLTAVEYDNLDAVAPAAAMNSNVLDMIKWMRLNIDNGMFDGKRIVGENTMKEIHRRQFQSYGLGWFLGTFRGKNFIRHSGGMTGMISYQMIIPEEKLGVIVLTNFAEYYGPSASSAIARYVLDRYIGGPEQDWSSEYLAARNENESRGAKEEEKTLAKRRMGTSPSLDLKDYTGKYSNPLSGEAKIFMQDGKLRFYYNEKHQGYLEHWNYDTFRITWEGQIFDMPSKSFISFSLDEFGKVERLKTSFYETIYFDKVDGK